VRAIVGVVDVVFHEVPFQSVPRARNGASQAVADRFSETGHLRVPRSGRGVGEHTMAHNAAHVKRTAHEPSIFGRSLVSPLRPLLGPR
jgi:hypothetical protein